MELKKFHVVKLGRGYARLDTGTHDALLEAAEFVRTLQHRQGLLLVGCPEEVAYTQQFITGNELRSLASQYENGPAERPVPARRATGWLRTAGTRKTLTFVAGLRRNGMTAPCVIDGS